MSLVLALLLGTTTAPVPRVDSIVAGAPRHKALRSAREARIQAILASVRAQDAVAFREASGAGVTFFFGHPSPREPDRPQAFTLSSLAPFVGCTPSPLDSGNSNNLLVHWDCPSNVAKPWSSTATYFVFEEGGSKLLSVRTQPGAPTLTIMRATPPRPLERETWFGAEDIPPQPDLAGKVVSVRVELAIAAIGNVTACKVLKPSEHAGFDATICRLMVQHARYTPATDRSGKPVAGVHAMTIHWAF